MTSPAPLVIDSFLVEDGSAVQFGAHVERFTAAVGAVGGPAGDVDALVARFLAEVPRAGRWFPRWAFSPPVGLAWQLRQAPPAVTVLAVPPQPVPDARTRPGLKGPDLDWLQRAASAARADGYDDVLLAREQGVVETTTCAIVLRDGERYVTPEGAMPSTTLGWFTERIEHPERRPVAADNLLAAMRDGRAWALNALHGPRALTTHPGADADAYRECWQAAWSADAEPLP